MQQTDKKYKRTTVTSALPYANGPVHIGTLRRLCSCRYLCALSAL